MTARDLKGRDRLRGQVPEIDPLFEHWLDLGKNLGSMTARTLRLLDLYGPEVLRLAVTEALQRGTYDLGALNILCEQRRHHPSPPLPVQFGDHVPERDVLAHDLGDYDD